ncbi:MAG: LysM peptidoglycan-binding domain-containing protein [Candidatus Shapirobacteria bacterium]|nr:LysM peptidoglycan-binding domain-containing protein [Candidatus Shapirobacteria bacterium]
MINWKRLKKKYFKSTEEIVSMFLGLVIVVVVVGLIFNFFQKRKGSVDIPGSSNVTLSDNINGSGEKSQIQENIYVVSYGDNLWKIAESKYNDGYMWVKIAEVNNLKNPSILEVGQKLILPILSQNEITSIKPDNSLSIPTGQEYEVKKGDNLWEIAVRAYGDGYQWVKIWQENRSKLNSPNALEIGMFLMISKLE